MSIISTSNVIDISTWKRHLTVAELAEQTDETEPSIRELQRIGVIAPAYFKGRTQFTLSAIFRVRSFRALQSHLGKASPIPAKVVREAGPQIDKLCTPAAVYKTDLSFALSKAVMAVIFTPEVEQAIASAVSAPPVEDAAQR